MKLLSIRAAAGPQKSESDVVITPLTFLLQQVMFPSAEHSHITDKLPVECGSNVIMSHSELKM